MCDNVTIAAPRNSPDCSSPELFFTCSMFVKMNRAVLRLDACEWCTSAVRMLTIVKCRFSRARARGGSRKLVRDGLPRCQVFCSALCRLEELGYNVIQSGKCNRFNLSEIHAGALNKFAKILFGNTQHAHLIQKGRH